MQIEWKKISLDIFSYGVGNKILMVVSNVDFFLHLKKKDICVCYVFKTKNQLLVLMLDREKLPPTYKSL